MTPSGTHIGFLIATFKNTWVFSFYQWLFLDKTAEDLRAYCWRNTVNLGHKPIYVFRSLRKHNLKRSLSLFAHLLSLHSHTYTSPAISFDLPPSYVYARVSRHASSIYTLVEQSFNYIPRSEDRRRSVTDARARARAPEIKQTTAKTKRSDARSRKWNLFARGAVSPLLLSFSSLPLASVRCLYVLEARARRY